MGSLKQEDGEDIKEINVLVTGFGPFGENQTNPSYLIASSLPTKLGVANQPLIKIHVYPSPIIVAYSNIRAIIPKLLFAEPSADASAHPHGKSDKARAQAIAPQPHPNYDIVLHIGMAPGHYSFSLETCAHRDGYKRKDVDGETMEDDSLWKQKYDAPKTLHTGFDTKDVLQRWQSGLPIEHLRSSNDAGYYLCDFIYYTSLVEYWHRDPTGPRPVMFLHVPGGFSSEDVERGRTATIGLITALVESRER